MSVICIKSSYAQEKNERTNHNLSKLAAKEIESNEALLAHMIPPHVIENLEKDIAFTDVLQSVTLLFADIVGFTD